ncbi:hypothetical protein DPMN_135355 [Dreissena polymorpha]|uniref:C2H2-type domain-containing protein n=1 Tax=Dreissena polymorpha TaxID=45954 RepID=A0A9D4FXZ3_DREPO|nr:hypothetical protein DPMN_135355 [Dreissena polymorpha]
MSKTRAGLLRHIRGHANSGSITAVGKHFRMPTILEGFNEQRTPMSCVCTVRQELCGQCGLAVRSENDLREHVNTHMHDKCYSSEECFKTYKRKTNLSRYVRTSHKSVNTD